MKNLFLQRAFYFGLALTFVTCAHADIQYTTQTSVAQDGALKPISSVTTWLKIGLQRLDTTQTIGTYKSSETTISNKATRQTTTYNSSLKMYYVEPLQQPSSVPATGGGTVDSTPSKAGVGTFILTVGARFLGLEKMLNRPVRHYTTSLQTDSSGCCGTGRSSIKTETWMADIQLPIFDSSVNSADWSRAYATSRSDCRVNFQRKGDIKSYEASQKGLAIKTIGFDAAGKPIFSSQLTSLSAAPLTATSFAVPAGFKKVTRAEYDAARTQAMIAAMTSKTDAQGEDSND